MISTYVDSHGDTLMMAGGALQAVDLRIVEADAPEGVRAPMVRIDNDELPSFVAALYRAAGLPAPVILDSGQPIPHVPGMLPGIDMQVRDGKVAIEGRGITRLYEPEAIRALAVSIVDVADQAQAGEPDSAAVKDLAATLWELPENVQSDAHAVARAALRWMKQREQS